MSAPLLPSWDYSSMLPLSPPSPQLSRPQFPTSHSDSLTRNRRRMGQAQAPQAPSATLIGGASRGPTLWRGTTSMEVITAIATSGHDTNAVRRAVIMYIVSKRKKGRSEQHIHEKLERLEVKFKHIKALHPAWRDARALFQLPKSDHIPVPMSIVRERENEQRRQLEWESSSTARSTSDTSSSVYASTSASTGLSSVLSTNSPFLSWNSDLSQVEEDPPIGHRAPFMLIHPATIQHCPYSPSIVTSRSLTSKVPHRLRASRYPHSQPRYPLTPIL
ncbi:hypothetical protein EDB19DRAFT_171090 [Suillus lakei]|nr:hypothetical protein EDB19DRAFT_171090 [Suillus lakei]